MIIHAKCSLLKCLSTQYNSSNAMHCKWLQEEAGEKKAEESKETKKKKTVKMVDLPIIAEVPQLSPEQLNLMVEKEVSGSMSGQVVWRGLQIHMVCSCSTPSLWVSTL